MESSSAAKTKNDKAWRNVSDEIKRIFRTAVLHLQEKGTMKSTEAKKFLCSGWSSPSYSCLLMSNLNGFISSERYS